MKKLLLSAFLLTSISFAQGMSDEEVVYTANFYHKANMVCGSSLVSSEKSEAGCSIKKKIEDVMNSSADSMLDLAIVYYQGSSEAGKEYKLSSYWMGKSANLGNLDAQKNLAMFYFTGTGVKQDIEQGVFWAEKASNQGDQDINMILGSLYYEGKLTNKDLDKAKLYYGKMCDAGIQTGCDFYKKANEEQLSQKNK